MRRRHAGTFELDIPIHLGIVSTATAIGPDIRGPYLHLPFQPGPRGGRPHHRLAARARLRGDLSRHRQGCRHPAGRRVGAHALSGDRPRAGGHPDRHRQLARLELVLVGIHPGARARQGDLPDHRDADRRDAGRARHPASRPDLGPRGGAQAAGPRARRDRARAARLSLGQIPAALSRPAGIPGGRRRDLFRPRRRRAPADRAAERAARAGRRAVGCAAGRVGLGQILAAARGRDPPPQARQAQLDRAAADAAARASARRVRLGARGGAGRRTGLAGAARPPGRRSTRPRH